MKDMQQSLQFIIGAVCTFFGYFFGEFNGLLKTVAIFAAADFVTGVMYGIVSKQLNSKISLKGVFKKISVFILIGVANILDVHVLNSGGVLRVTVMFFFISNEGISLLENMAKLGLPVPKKIVDVLAQLKPKDEEKDNQQGK